MGKRDKKAVLKIILYFSITLTLSFIFINSALPKTISSEGSGSVYKALISAVSTLFGENFATAFSQKFTPLFLRKLTHFLEFSLLSVQIITVYALSNRLTIKNLFELFAIGLLVAVVDESIQILSQRGASVIDVLIDLSGYALVLLVYCGLYFLVKKRKKEKDNYGKN